MRDKIGRLVLGTVVVFGLVWWVGQGLAWLLK